MFCAKTAVRTSARKQLPASISKKRGSSSAGKHRTDQVRKYFIRRATPLLHTWPLALLRKSQSGHCPTQPVWALMQCTLPSLMCNICPLHSCRGMSSVLPQGCSQGIPGLCASACLHIQAFFLQDPQVRGEGEASETLWCQF